MLLYKLFDRTVDITKLQATLFEKNVPKTLHTSKFYELDTTQASI